MLGLVGESGCGKSVTALSVMGLLPRPAMRAVSGSIKVRGKDVMQMSDKELIRMRGGDAAMIFQEPMTSLNPVYRVGQQITESLFLHGRVSYASRRRNGRRLAAQLLEDVGLSATDDIFQRYPHQLSGGQRQRVMIAMSLACNPAVLIADEPTTALDVTVQAQILELLDNLRRTRGLAVLLITHDLSVVSQYCDTLAVMYCGQIVESGTCASVMAQPRHRYTQALLNTIPVANTPGIPLPAIHGHVPAPGAWPEGCRFANRCEYRLSRCECDEPLSEPCPGNAGPHIVKCWNPVV